MSKFIPNSFQVPNVIVDEFLSKLSGNAFKCYAVVARKTTGWQKKSDRISIAQFMALCGIKDRKTAFACLAELEAFLLIKTFKSQGEITEFSLNFDFEEVEIEPVPKKGTSTKISAKPVPKNHTTTSTKNWDTTKNTIKNTIQNISPLNPPKGGECVVDEPVLTTSPSEQTEPDELEDNFNAFWQAGMRRIGRVAAEKAFKRAYQLWRKDTRNKGQGLVEFTEMLIADIRKRNGLQQFGFENLHPATYLNGQRWTDEYKQSEQRQLRSNLDGEWNTPEAWENVF